MTGDEVPERRHDWPIEQRRLHRQAELPGCGVSQRREVVADRRTEERIERAFVDAVRMVREDSHQFQRGAAVMSEPDRHRQHALAARRAIEWNDDRPIHAFRLLVYADTMFNGGVRLSRAFARSVGGTPYERTVRSAFRITATSIPS